MAEARDGEQVVVLRKLKTDILDLLLGGTNQLSDPLQFLYSSSTITFASNSRAAPASQPIESDASFQTTCSLFCCARLLFRGATN